MFNSYSLFIGSPTQEIFRSEWPNCVTDQYMYNIMRTQNNVKIERDIEQVTRRYVNSIKADLLCENFKCTKLH